jgi:hypothetical protein
MSSRFSFGPMTRRRIVLLAVLGLGAIGGFTTWSAWHRSHSQTTTEDESWIDGDPRLTYPTRYLNVRPEVKYVGDAACAVCHKEIVESYRHHPMAHSLDPVSEVAAEPRYGSEVGNPFQNEGVSFAVERRGERVFHREYVPNVKGGNLVEAEDEVRYVIGSSKSRTFTYYLIERDDCLFQSPITWYSQKQHWDLSPGMRVRFEHFERRITPACLFCHANRVEPVADSINRYQRPLFRGMGIGCERCHGPGELHAAHPGAAHGDDGADLTIVNPNRPGLAPSLRDAVCEQCHLQGETRVARRGRGTFDYRPGLPLHLFVSAFVRAEESEEDLKFVSHVEQMHSCRCSTESKGALSCTTCHDPHGYPSEERREARHRAACVKCHGESECKASIEERRTKKDSCVACHMPRRSSVEEVQHTVITDHHIVRRPTADKQRPLPPTARGKIPIVPFHAASNDLPKAERDYDLAMALLTLVPPEHYGMSEQDVLAAAKPLLDQSLRRWPDDLDALERRAYVYGCLGRFPEALADTEAVLERSPDRQASLLQAARFSAELGRGEEALAHVQRALAISPSASMPHVVRAQIYHARGEFAKEANDWRAALRYNPTHVRSRFYLVAALARSGDKKEARAEFDKLMALNPPDADNMRTQLEGLLR